MNKFVSILLLLVLGSISMAWSDEKKYDWITYSLLLQNWDTQTVDGRNVSIVRRAENKLIVKFLPQWSATVMVDPAKTLTPGKDNSWLQDAFFQWKINPNWKWTIGQFKIPFGEEGLHSAAHLDTIERAQFNLGANKISDLRELGTMAEYQDQHLLAQFGVFSGDPPNQNVGASLREGVVRVVYSPDSHFHFGGSLSRGSRHNVDKPLDQLELSNKNGFEFLWENKPWLVETEFVSGQLNVPAVSGGVITSVTPVTRQGWYAKVRYDVSQNLQIVLREDTLFTNVNAPSNGEQDITAGINYWFQKKPQEVLLQVNYVNRHSLSSVPVPSIWRANLELFF